MARWTDGLILNKKGQIIGIKGYKPKSFDLREDARKGLDEWFSKHGGWPPLKGSLMIDMNVNDLVEAFGLPRYYASRLPAGASLVATVKSDGSVAVEIHPGHYVPEPPSALPVIEQKRGPGRPRKAVSE